MALETWIAYTQARAECWHSVGTALCFGGRLGGGPRCGCGKWWWCRLPLDTLFVALVWCHNKLVAGAGELAWVNEWIEGGGMIVLGRRRVFFV